MKCAFCGHVFDVTDADTACKACPLNSGCHLIRCPRCGYEMPPEAQLTRWLRDLRDRAKGKLEPQPRQEAE